MRFDIDVAAVKRSTHGGYGRRLAVVTVRVDALSVDVAQTRAHELARPLLQRQLPGLKMTTEVIATRPIESA